MSLSPPSSPNLQNLQHINLLSALASRTTTLISQPPPQHLPLLSLPPPLPTPLLLAESSFRRSTPTCYTCPLPLSSLLPPPLLLHNAPLVWLTFPPPSRPPCKTSSLFPPMLLQLLLVLHSTGFAQSHLIHPYPLSYFSCFSFCSLFTFILFFCIICIVQVYFFSCFLGQETNLNGTDNILFLFFSFLFFSFLFFSFLLILVYMFPPITPKEVPPMRRELDLATTRLSRVATSSFRSTARYPTYKQP